jgi:hypothetical protein
MPAIRLSRVTRLTASDSGMNTIARTIEATIPSPTMSSSPPKRRPTMRSARREATRTPDSSLARSACATSVHSPRKSSSRTIGSTLPQPTATEVPAPQDWLPIATTPRKTAKAARIKVKTMRTRLKNQKKRQT